MNKSTFLLFFLFCYGISQAQLNIPRDRTLHFGAGLIIGGVGGYAANLIFKSDPYWIWAGAIGSSLAAGITKEALDKAEYGVWDNNDILFTVIGGVVSGIVLDLLIKDRRRGYRSRACNCYAIRLNPKIIRKVVEVDLASFGTRDLKANLQATYMLQK